MARWRHMLSLMRAAVTQFVTLDGVPIAKCNKDELPCLSDSKLRLAYLIKEPGDEVRPRAGPAAFGLTAYPIVATAVIALRCSISFTTSTETMPIDWSSRQWVLRDETFPPLDVHGLVATCLEFISELTFFNDSDSRCWPVSSQKPHGCWCVMFIQGVTIAGGHHT